MHPSLKLSNLFRLPEYLKQRANSAAQGSFEDMLYLVEELSNQPESIRRLMTPVFYGTLDPADVAALHQLDSLDTDGLAALIADRSVPREAYHDLWSRIWDWITFLDAFREHLRFTDPLWLLIGSTPGVWVVIARAWGMLLHAEDIPGLNGISVVLASVKAGYDCTGIATLDDLISGAGGG
ncbi:hypothetical protein GGX14DRAFT_623535 [Mycena pura]|uniref:Uncharacterized protein n=1 Tax=Mycena pura TaxID=153505 RepID=A0AAD6VFX2_9AGAR|nr:hypothetical protein GGX14DRAFT_623535 [Mycena pura]